jgi:hypothetical protein
MKYTHSIRVLLWIAVIAGVAGCSSGSGTAPSGSGSTTPTPAQSGSVYVLGTDAPLPSVVSFAVSVQSITLSNGSSTSVSILNGAQTVDFARFNGLNTPALTPLQPSPWAAQPLVISTQHHPRHQRSPPLPPVLPSLLSPSIWPAPLSSTPATWMHSGLISICGNRSR